MTDPGVAWKRVLQPDECPDLDALFQALGEETLAPEFERHLQGCPRCEAEAALFREFQHGAPRMGEDADIEWIVGRLAEDDPTATIPHSPAPSQQGGWSARIPAWLAGFGWRRWAPLAAAVVLAIMLRNWVSGPPEVLDIPDVSIVRAGQVEAVGPLGTLAGPPSELRWKEVAGAAKYSVGVFEVDQTELWNAETAQASIAIPEQLQQRMTVGRRFLWEVKAFDATGAQIGGTAVADFEIRVDDGPATPRG